ncbi:HEPN domain-containing protein [Gloeobacter violaceus]|uniref:UPF0332 protein glr0978 n=1 Tax=Gloeobacter violaceus (strain ATCC 29082 / PCC 7421) TaxID=251221 RepID=Y978_GLOVI|nr:HEPN domain-containing protein [Gloeobacter violaceus]Q7NLZ1.1 RecName: Full=UPF0332 protein glr0978 [Gloeobacter violaceus PCC 7421]BAC88919.1 glr0978 [Gloeobacter violaceus PCC 7421]
MTPEQQDLMDRAEQSLQAARILADEALFDVSVSRSYYAMFYCARASLLALNLSSKSHSGTISLFGQHLAAAGRLPIEIHRQLIDAERLRILGDYGGANSHCSQQDAQVLIAQSARFMQIAMEFLAQ